MNTFGVFITVFFFYVNIRVNICHVTSFVSFVLQIRLQMENPKAEIVHVAFRILDWGYVNLFNIVRGTLNLDVPNFVS